MTLSRSALETDPVRRAELQRLEEQHLYEEQSNEETAVRSPWSSTPRDPDRNRKQRRQDAKALRTARKRSDALHRICRNIDIPAAIEHFARMNHGKRLNQFDALIAIHRTRLKLPGMTEQESAESLEWLNLQRIPV